MDEFRKNIDIRWADLDPNFHVRHSVYYDYGANVRIEYLQQQGISLQLMQEKAFGLVIFREECIFKKEITLKDTVSINMKLTKAKADYSRWSIEHIITKNGNTISAILTLDGSWIDIIKRKLTVPPEEARHAFDLIPRSEHFEWIIK